MAEATEAMEESGSDSEAETADLTKQTPCIFWRKMTTCQSDDQEDEKINKIVKKVRDVLQLGTEERKERKSTILVFYYRFGKKKNGNQAKTNPETPHPTVSSSSGEPEVSDLEEPSLSSEKPLENSMPK